MANTGRKHQNTPTFPPPWGSPQTKCKIKIKNRYTNQSTEKPAGVKTFRSHGGFRRRPPNLKTIVNFVYKKIQIANSSPIRRARRELSNALTPVFIAHTIREICSIKPWTCPTGRNALPFPFRTALHPLAWTSPSNQVSRPRCI